MTLDLMKLREVAEAIRELDAAEAAVDLAEHKALKRAGWKFTCNTPGGVWMAERTLEDGRVVLVSGDVAIRMTRTMVAGVELEEESHGG